MNEPMNGLRCDAAFDGCCEFFSKPSMMTAREQENEIDLIDLCEKNPELANSIVSSAGNLHKKTFRNIPYALFTDKAFNSRNVNKIVMTGGTVIRAYEVLIKNVTSELVCLKCNAKTHVAGSSEKKKEAMVCEACGSSLLKDKKCFGEVISSQRIRLQDIGNPNSMSETFEVVLEEDLAGKFFPGDKLLVTGVVSMRWRPFRVGEQMGNSIYMHAFAAAKQEEESLGCSFSKTYMSSLEDLSYFQKRAFLISSFAEEIQGLENVKLGILLALVSGAHGADQKSSTRANSHILLVGDPGMGKSHLLKTCAKLVSPSIVTNGVGTTQAGLTTCAVKQGKEWSLEAGALVLADMGVCCIDEFNKLRINEKSGLLEAMEQQTLSIAKAGIVSSLNTRCAVIAATNVRYRYDQEKSISENILITTPLVGRFDLVFGIFDSREPEADALICDKILSRKAESNNKRPETVYWNCSILKSYIAIVRKKPSQIPEELSSILLNYYHGKRKIDGVSEFNTVRMLESLVRLAEAHSKLLNSDVVCEDDVYTAILLLEGALNSAPSKIDLQKIFTDEACYGQAVVHLKAEIKKNMAWMQ
ncbi:Cdc46/Mcm ATPase [Biomphalaria pfeifferi]|uniref:DNA helicase n=1 Tax=Biomphalaria pfeifferi TaxID=112525 RepID=A0AAD8ANQ7_BIOPF|nr:Cdc46/Mcm ATPase [Biomphalaria pfeifferi]